MDTPPWSDAELMAVLLSREVREGEISACGAHSMIPAAGLLLAKERHAPGAQLIILGSKAFMPFDTSRQFHYLAQRGDLGLFFVSGVQIDQYGNYNLHQLGEDVNRPRLRMPGGYGGGMIYYAARRTIVFRTEHTRRSLVPRVDFVSAAGSTPPHVLRHGGPSKVITPKATFRFEREPGLLRLESVHPPYTALQVAEDTGFDLGPLDAVPPTPAPTSGELRTLREKVRTTMMETGTYADWAAKQLGAGQAA
ncbi:MAG TPA: CoA-transferase [bacterium]|nr:CoA-transferase [bacterium]